METFEKWFLWFMLYSVIGWVYETILCSVKEHRFINRGFLNGPYCPIYGVGAVVNLLVMGNLKNPALLFVCGALLDCTLEYLTSWGMETLFHARWWDYSDKPLNINGRVCMLGAVAFGAFTTVLVLIIHPFLIEKLSFITDKIRDMLFYITATIFIADSVYTFIGFSPFNKLLGNIAKPSLAGMCRPEELNREAESLRFILNSQIRRMLRAFPALKSTRYGSVVDRLREHIADLEQKRRELFGKK